MDGVLVVDKPSGMTSHDVVAAARRLLGERRIGHTGTLDPLATGVLPLACGRATRLARFFSSSDKEYETSLRLGLTTDSYDVTGRETGRSPVPPTAWHALEATLGSFLGEHQQTPPSFSAKKVGGTRAYELARREKAPDLAPVAVRLESVEIIRTSDTGATLRLTCSAGFYVRAFVHALGERIGCGACVETLRRTRAGDFSLAAAVTLDRVASGDVRPVPVDSLLPGVPAVTVTEEGRIRVEHGRSIDARHCGPSWLGGTDGWVRLMDSTGCLLAMGKFAPGPSLHPEVVLV